MAQYRRVFRSYCHISPDFYEVLILFSSMNHCVGVYISVYEFGAVCWDYLKWHVQEDL
jgi:hypothetical protein